jgi:amino acid adenylation domain-containing protein
MTTVSDLTEQVPAPAYGEGDVYVLPASFAQSRLWFLQQLEPESAAYNIDVALRTFGALRLDALEAACVALVSRHESLRTTLVQEGSEPEQVVHPPPECFPIEFVDLEQTRVDEREATLRALIETIGRRPFDLERGPLLRMSVARVSADEHVLIPSMHHVISDGWSLGILLRELGALYGAAVQTTPDNWADASLIELAALEPLPIQYADYATWQREWLSSDDVQRQEAFWREQLHGPLPMLDLLTDRPRARTHGNEGATHRFHLSREVSAALHALASAEGATLYMALLAAYGVLLHRYTGDEDFVVGAPIAGRTRGETEGLIGMFVNTLALRVDVSGEPTFRQLLARVRETLVNAYAHQDFPFERLVQLLQPPRDRHRTPIFQTMCDLQNTRELSGEAAGTFGGLRTSRVATPATTAKTDLQVSFNEGDAGLRGVIIYPSALFDASTIARMAEHFQTLAGAIVGNPDVPVAQLSMLPPDERALVVDAWNDTATAYPRNATIDALFAEQAERRPNAIAVECDDARLTYAELDSFANWLAGQLAGMGVQPGDRVGLYVDRSLALVVGMLAILKAGAAYVPLDPAYPPDRLGFMLTDAGVDVVLGQRSLGSVIATITSAAGTNGKKPRVLYLGDRGQAEGVKTHEDITVVSGGKPESSAYVMYTSGSTGRPKGVVVPHRAVVRLVRDTNYIRLSDDDVVLGFAPTAFDASTLEVWGALLNGGRLVLAPPGMLNLSALGELVERSGVTTLWLTAALFQQVVDAGLDAYRGVKYLLAGGDILPVPHVRRVLAELPDVKLINGYGPTENTTFTCCYRVPRDWPADAAIPIGHPIANTRVYVLDRLGAPVPIGVPGELFAGGDGVALGYLDRAELTAERFVPDPFSGREGDRLYRTGDRVRWRADGAIDFLGRVDDQVKLRGFRIEPDEVRACMLAIVGVRDAAVIVSADEAGNKHLIGYYVTQPSANVATTDVLNALRTQLPAHMVPSLVMPLDTLPMTPSGKVDRRALPAPEWNRAVDARPYKAPRSNVEHELVQIWEQLLPGRRIGLYDDFFEIGGHSLLALQMLAAVERMRGRRVPLAWLFESSTVERLAARLGEQVQAEREPLLVTLQPTAAGQPAAFVHGDVRGGGWYCRRLAPLAAPDSPFHLLGTVGIDGEVRPWTIEAMAKIHVAELRKAQPHGPYRLGGFCIGGIIAFEMAVQLQALGERVDRLVIVDSMPANSRVRSAKVLLPLVPGADDNDRMSRQSVLMTRLRWYELRIRQIRRQSMRHRLEWVGRNVSRRWRNLIGPRNAGAIPVRAEHGRVTHDDQTRALASALRTQIAAGPGAGVLLMQDRAASVYFPGHFRGTIDLIWANERPDVKRIDPMRGWDRHADDVRVYPILSTHIGLVTNDLPKLAEALKVVLDRDGA